VDALVAKIGKNRQAQKAKAKQIFEYIGGNTTEKQNARKKKYIQMKDAVLAPSINRLYKAILETQQAETLAEALAPLQLSAYLDMSKLKETNAAAVEEAKSKRVPVNDTQDLIRRFPQLRAPNASSVDMAKVPSIVLKVIRTRMDRKITNMSNVFFSTIETDETEALQRRVQFLEQKQYNPMEEGVTQALLANYNETLQEKAIDDFSTRYTSHIKDPTLQARSMTIIGTLFRKMQDKERREDYARKLQKVAQETTGVAILGLIHKMVSSREEALTHSKIEYRHGLAEKLFRSFHPIMVRNAASEFLAMANSTKNGTNATNVTEIDADPQQREERKPGESKPGETPDQQNKRAEEAANLKLPGNQQPKQAMMEDLEALDFVELL